MRVYLDLCCLNRPFDDLSFDRVRLESEAVLTVISRCESEQWVMLTSDILDFEKNKQTDLLKLEKVDALLTVAKEKLATTELVLTKAAEFQKAGIKIVDSIHLATAHENSVDVFLTTDDSFLRRAKSLGLSMKVENPATWILEVI